MRAVDLHHGASSEVGHVRTANEDAFLVAPPLFVVADGMGGHEGGDVASRIVVEEFARLPQDGRDSRAGAEAVVSTLARCQVRIREYATTRSGTGRRVHAGTTVVVALLVADDDGPKWLLANLGDSRIYRVVEGELDQVSVDHSVVQELVDAGEITAAEAAEHPERNVITRALGAALGTLEPDFFLLPLAAAERIVLCTDGVTGMIDDATMASILARSPDPRDAADGLVQAALVAGGHDNATAVVVDVVGSATDESFDLVRRRESLETKLGTLP
ncbi:PP2C family serine/threonine-protein phosphatase [uncultured Nocardioides sp.]|uniref:PP2C family protein-serine/threonine phosphatase n=1 Tax=uncultured Nocardioides sp. TaxID=198441 RepID=UPI0025FFF71F|nr:protein phosphatase 2C domain-containing protein [uncultured Nocardioides sp.]